MARQSTSRSKPGNARPWIVWLRDDLRLTRHAALRAAASRGPVLPVYVVDAQAWARAPGAASCWWRRASLNALHSDIAARGGHLIIRRGRAQTVLAELVDASGAAGVCALRAYDADGRAQEAHVARGLSRRAAFETFAGDVLVEPGDLLTQSGAPYRVFTPFWRALSERIEPQRQVVDDAEPFAWYQCDLRSETGAAIDVPGEAFGWTRGLEQSWRPGEQSARQRLQVFVADGLATYAEDRDLPAVAGTSRLSPHLRFGEISMREAWDTVARLREGSAIARSQCEAWLRELGWREFCRHLLFHFPDMETQNFQRRYDAFEWRSDPAGLRAWQRGRTGYPLVDAGMRELRRTGWMHNRVRMVAASFLTKHLRIHWRDGEAWFRDSLVDADDASNAANWQWTAGTGADAAPYFRIFNPSVQAAKFDRTGRYLRRWLPELAGLSDKSLREPWRADAVELANANVVVGQSYPVPIVEHAAAREAALAANAALR